MTVTSPESSCATGYEPLTRARTAVVAIRSWWLVAVIWVALHRRPLPEVVAELGSATRPARHHFRPDRLGRTVGRVLEVGPCRPRCLYRALVLFNLLRSQGEIVEVVLGLPGTPTGSDAHAWVEWAGTDVGPPPGGRQHVALARFR